MNNTTTPASASAMIQFNPLMPVSLVVLYWCLSVVILIFCVVSAVAMKRTKRTPHGTKLLSLGLIMYDILFLIVSPVSKLFDFNDSYPIWHATRGFQIAAQIVVASMSIERLFVLNWPYTYLRVVTERRIKVVCSTVIIFGYLHFVVYKGSACYARGMVPNCGFFWSSYLVTLSFLLPAVSFACFVKIYKIICRSEGTHRPMHTVRQYKGTVASFMVLVNATFNQIVWICLSVLYFIRARNGGVDDGLFGTLGDWSNLVSCIVDPLIYVMWFNETKMQLLSIFQRTCPFVRPKIERLRVEIYHLDFHPREAGDLVLENRAMDPVVVVSNPIQPAAS